MSYECKKGARELKKLKMEKAEKALDEKKNNMVLCNIAKEFEPLQKNEKGSFAADV